MNPQTLQVFIKPLSGGKEFVLQIDQNTNVSDLVDLISDKEGIPVNDVKLRYTGRLLDRKKKNK
jgi:hypothetical protein